MAKYWTFPKGKSAPIDYLWDGRGWIKRSTKKSTKPKDLFLVYDKHGKWLKTYTKPPTSTQLEQINKALKPGWHLESARHALAAKGVKTGRKKKHKQYKYYRT